MHEALPGDGPRTTDVNAPHTRRLALAVALTRSPRPGLAAETSTQTDAASALSVTPLSVARM
jgi:hypothetical protein